ncbi:MAG: hypothetical protein R3315_11675, partial [Woeseiaceae bacterium]|nr:hypothetical protein [Woeseiaceae bacterium]
MKLLAPCPVAAGLAAGSAFGEELPAGYWPVARSQPILDVTLDIALAPDLSALTEAERAAIPELMAAGQIVHRLYLAQRHGEALDALAALETLHENSGRTRPTGNLLDLFYLFKGPIATTLDNDRQAFLPVAPEQPGKNVYPEGIDRKEIDAWLAAHPAAAADVLGVRSVVRRATPGNLAADLARLERHAALDVLHPGLRERLGATHEAAGLYAV